jgi:phosphate transport system protein
MRETFHGELTRLCEGLADMCGLAAEAMQLATRVLLTADLELAQQVQSADAELDQVRSRCETHANTLLALQAPVASDLRAVLVAVYCADKIERMGDLAAHIAATARFHHPARIIPPELEGVFSELGKIAAGMAYRVGEMFAAAGPNDGFAELDQTDQVVDTLHAQILTLITKPDWPHGTRSATSLALLSRFYERFADQAVSVAKRLDFADTGRLPS